MTIKEKVVIKGEGHFKGYEHVFEFVDDNRKVDIKTTGALICKIKRWLDFSPKTKNEKLKAYKAKWNTYLKFHLIPDGINPQIDAGQYFVKLNYKLLEPNKLLDYNVALFLLLGLNAWSLGRRIKDFPVLDGDEPAGFFELEFWKTPQNEALRVSAFVVGRKITSENLKTLAEANGFFREAAPANNLKVEKGFIKEMTTNENPTERDKRVKIVKDVLILYLEKRGKPISVLALSEYPDFHKELAEKGLVIIDNNEDNTKHAPDIFIIKLRTLGVYLTEIVTSPEWKDQPEDIQDKLTYTPKPKK